MKRITAFVLFAIVSIVAATGKPALAEGINDVQAMVQVLNSETKAFESVRQGALEGTPHAQYLLGIMYIIGVGTAQSNENGIKWFRTAAENGEVEAQRDLSKILIAGELTTQDFTEAAKWAKEAANQLEPQSMWLLGLLYQTGKGLKKDVVQAYAWNNLAAAKGNETAIKNRQDMAENMTKTEIAKAQAMAKTIEKKILADQKAKEDSKYSQESVSLSMTKVPINYHGNNFQDICLTLNDVKLTNAQNKIESENKYLSRISKKVANTRSGKLNLGGLLALEDVMFFINKISYNDETKQLQVGIGISNNFTEIDMPSGFIRATLAFKMQVLSNPEKESAFDGYSHFLLFNNFDKSNILEDGKQLNINFDISKDAAEELISNKSLGMLYITKIKYPFSFTSKKDDRKDASISYYLVTSVEECWLYDKKTGKIFAKSKFKTT